MITCEKNIPAHVPKDATRGCFTEKMGWFNDKHLIIEVGAIT